MKYRFYFIRHGETNWNLQGKMQGWINTVLNKTGQQQAFDSIKVLKKYPIERIISSTLLRAQETAEIINTHFRVPFTQTDDLKEINLGDIEGKTNLFIQQNNSQNSLKIPTDDFTAYPNGESWHDVLNRVQHAIKQATQQFSEKNILMVTHGGILYKLYLHITNKTVLFENCRGFCVWYDTKTDTFSDIQMVS